MPAYSSLPYNEVLLLDKLRKNNKSGFKRIFECYYPRIYFFAWRLLKQDAASNRIALDCFVKLAGVRGKLVNLQDLVSFLYSCAQEACREFCSRNDFYGYRRALMGYNLREKKRNSFLDILIAEASFAIYLEMEKEIPASAELRGMIDVLSDSMSSRGADAGAAPGITPVSGINVTEDVAMRDIMRLSALIKDFILDVVYHQKGFGPFPGRLRELNDWLMADIDRRILMDEIKDPANRSNAAHFFRNIDSGEGFETIRRRIPFTGPLSFIGARLANSFSLVSSRKWKRS